MTRKPNDPAIDTNLLMRSARRCCLCFSVDQDLREKLGQIAHLDHNRANGSQDNLAFLCMQHHSLYDSRTSQHKNYTIHEVKSARARLYRELRRYKPLAWVLVIDGKFSDFDEPLVQAITEHLRRILNDPHITITQVLQGSTVLVVSSSEKAFKLLNRLFVIGELKELVGYRIREIKLLNQGILERFFSLAAYPARKIKLVLHRARKFAKRHRRLRLAAQFVTALLLTLGIEQWLKYTVAENDNIVTEEIFNIKGVYHYLVTAGPSKPKSRFTALVKLSPVTTPRGIDPFSACPERGFIGELLKGLSHAHPNVVVLDKRFGASRCPSDDPDTAKLIAGIRTMCEEGATVVVGRAIEEEERRRPGVEPFYHLEPTLDFVKAGCACVRESIVNRNRDIRLVSLWWPDVQPVADNIDPPRSMALVAALAAMPNLLNNSRLKGWPPASPPPYVTFIRSGEFDSVTLPANQAICASPQKPGWRACESNELGPQVQKIARGKVIVIGEDYPDLDRHPTPVGDFAGYVVQANYIESLLDDRIIRPVPWELDWLAGIAIFITFEWLFWHYHGFRGVISVAGLFGVVFLIVYLTVTALGYYLNPAAISIFSILNSRVIEWILT